MSDSMTKKSEMAKWVFGNKKPPEKLDEILPPDIDPSFRNYDKNYKLNMAKKLEQEIKKQNDD